MKSVLLRRSSQGHRLRGPRPPASGGPTILRAFVRPGESTSLVRPPLAGGLGSCHWLPCALIVPTPVLLTAALLVATLVMRQAPMTSTRMISGLTGGTEGACTGLSRLAGIDGATSNGVILTSITASTSRCRPALGTVPENVLCSD